MQWNITQYIWEKWGELCIVLYLFNVPSDPDTGDNHKI
jgi:hypothetical protein